VWITDTETRETIRRVHAATGYTLDPHGAVGWRAAEKLSATGSVLPPIAVLETAHPAKFAETVEPLVGKVPLPPSLETALHRTIESVTIPATVESLVELMM
jgi:threonine synthase